MRNIICWLSLSLIMIPCIIANIIFCNWISLPICAIALVLDVFNLFLAFKNWHKEKKKNKGEKQ